MPVLDDIGGESAQALNEPCVAREPQLSCWQRPRKRFATFAAVFSLFVFVGIFLARVPALKQTDVLNSEISQEVAARLCTPRGASCLESKCCQETGMQCYTKSVTWASCLPNCTSGLHPADTNPTRWKCEPLGARTAGVPPMDYWGGLKPAPWVAAKCSANGENCSSTGCCQEPGMTCFTKDTTWASCKPSCEPGPDPTDLDPTPWNCVPLGNPTPGALTPFYWKGRAVGAWVATKCSAIGANCMSTRCCSQPGHTCFKKNGNWAMCKPWCAPGPDLWDSDPQSWDCTPMGSRTPGEPQPPGPLASWVNTRCTSGTSSCLASQCCKDPGMQCYQKNDVHAACMKSCFKGIHCNDPDKSPWTCKTLGQRMPGNWPSPSFFCWLLTRSSGDEANLVRVQLVNHWGIFQCEEWTVFSNVAIDLGMGEQSMPIGDFSAQKGKWGSWLNTVDFAKAWHAIYDSGQYLNHDWIVKADPDAAFFLDRLKANLASLPLNQPWAMHNSNTATPMLGPIEVMNKAALIIYFANNPPHLSGTDKAVCENAYMPFSGEDGFLSGCLQKLGIPAVYHKHLLFNHIPVKCTNPAYVAFHPAKTEADYRRCVKDVIMR